MRRVPTQKWTLVLVAASIFISVVISIAITSGRWRDESEPSDIVALVNGEAITRSELRRVQTDLRAREEFRGTETDGKSLEQLALRQAIQRRLMLQEAARRDLSVSEQEIDEALSELRSRFADLESFGAWMHERNFDDRLLIETMRDELLASRVSAALAENAVVTEEQVREYYEAHRDSLSLRDEVRLRIIALESSDEAEDIMSALQSGETFTALARSRSRGQRAREGGDTGWIDPATLGAPLRQVVARMKEGEAYGPLEKDPGEFLIVALAGRRPVPAANLDEARPEIERRLLPLERREAITKWLAEQEEQATIDLLLH